MSLSTTTVESIREEQEEEEESLVFTDRFDEVLQKTGRILTAVG